MTNTETVSTERLAFLRLWAEQSEDEITLKASEVRELLASRTQSPAEWQVEAVGRYIAEKIFGSSWAGLGSDGRVTDRGFPIFSFSRHGGICCQGRQDDLRDVAREILRAASISAPERSKEDLDIEATAENIARNLSAIDGGRFHEPTYNAAKAGAIEGLKCALSALETPPLHKEGEAAKHSDACGCGYCT